MVTVVSEMGDEIEPPPPEELPVSYSRASESLETYVSNQPPVHEELTLEEIPEQSVYLPLEIPEQWDYMHVGPAEADARLEVDYTSTFMEYLVGPPTAEDPDDMTDIGGDDDEATKAWKKYMYSWGRHSTEADMSRYFRQMGYSAPEYR